MDLCLQFYRRRRHVICMEILDCGSHLVGCSWYSFGEFTRYNYLKLRMIHIELKWMFFTQLSIERLLLFLPNTHCVAISRKSFRHLYSIPVRSFLNLTFFN